MKPADEEARSHDKDLDWHRERRLKDAMDSEARPLVWRLRQADEIAQWLSVAFVAIDVAAAILGHFIGIRATLYVLAFVVVAFRVHLASLLWCALRGVFVAYREYRARPTAAAKPALTKEDVLPTPDTFEGISLDKLSRDIAFSGQEKITRDALMVLGISRIRGAQELQHILMKSEFLVYAIASSPTSYPVGAERIAAKRRELNMAVALHPTLMSSPAEDRALVIANAMRRALGFTVDADPRIQGEPSPECRLVSPSERVPRSLAA